MGSYITIGFVCGEKIKKDKFIDIAKKTLQKNESSNFKAKYPISSDLENWDEKNFEYDSIQEMMLRCLDKKEAYISFDYANKKNNIKDIILQFEEIKNDSIGMLISIPESGFENLNIDEVEKNITERLKSIIDLGYDYIFCDNEAYIEHPIKEVFKNKNLYSILILKDKNVKLSNWKIDGLQERQNI